MPYLLQDLVIDRVDVVEEGACSAAFIEIIKAKGDKEAMTFEEILAKMKPEHADAIRAELKKSADQVDTLTSELTTAKADLEKSKKDLEAVTGELTELKKSCEDKKTDKAAGNTTSFDEDEVVKSMPEAAQQLFKTLKAQKEAAEEQVRKAQEDEVNAKALSKAKELKALPIEEAKLAEILKTANEATVNLLTATAAAIEGTVLGEVGKSAQPVATGNSNDAWGKIEKAAEEVAKTQNVTVEKAISIVIKEKPELYKEYLEGGAN